MRDFGQPHYLRASGSHLLKGNLGPAKGFVLFEMTLCLPHHVLGWGAFLLPRALWRFILALRVYEMINLKLSLYRLVEF